MTRARILPTAWVAPALQLVLVCATLTVALAVYTHGRRTTPVDLTVDGWLHARAAALQPLFQGLVGFAAPPTMMWLSVSLGVVVLAYGQRRAAVLCIVGPGLALFSASFLQHLLLRPSATFGDPLAYPSGHMTGTAALLTVVLVLTARDRPLGMVLGPRTTHLVRVVFGVIACSVALALIALRDHYVTDVAGGMALAVGAVLTTALVLDATDQPEARAPAPHSGGPS